MTRAMCALAVLLAWTRPAAAEINMADSLAWAAADSDLVVRGVVTRVVERKGPGSVVWYDAVLRVDETLKGKRRKQVRFTMRHLYGESPADWRADKVELLLFLVDARTRLADDKGYAGAGFALRRAVWLEGAAIRLTGDKIGPAYTMDWKLLKDRKAILSAARAAVKAAPAVKGSHQVEVPYNTPVFGALYGGSSVYLIVPIDGRLETRARAWVTSKDMQQRIDAVKALAHFRSPRTIALLRTLLADPDYYEVSNPRVKRYEVRRLAYEQLVQWKVKVARPVIETPLP